jgi:hypothetical protein
MGLFVGIAVIVAGLAVFKAVPGKTEFGMHPQEPQEGPRVTRQVQVVSPVQGILTAGRPQGSCPRMPIEDDARAVEGPSGSGKRAEEVARWPRRTRREHRSHRSWQQGTGTVAVGVRKRSERPA